MENYFYQEAPWAQVVPCIILTSRGCSHDHIYDGRVARWAPESNLLAFVRIQGLCSGEKVHLVLMMLGVWGWGGVMVAHCPGGDTHSVT